MQIWKYLLSRYFMGVWASVLMVFSFIKTNKTLPSFIKPVTWIQMRKLFSDAYLTVTKLILMVWTAVCHLPCLKTYMRLRVYLT